MGRLAHYVFLTSPAILSIVSLVCLAAVALPRARPGLQFATVDTSNVEVKVGNDVFHGLPDSYDYSKHKDFFTIHLWNYCSGTIQNGVRHVDFCSKNGKLIFNLFGFWKSWGVSVHRQDVRFYWLDHGPRLLFIAYTVSGILKSLEVIASVASIFHRWVGVVVLATASSLALLATSIMTQVTYHTLVSRADDEDIPITAQDGRIAYALNWSATALSLAAMTLWYLQFCSPFNRGGKGKAAAEKAPYTYEQMGQSYTEEDGRDTLHLLSKRHKQCLEE